MAGIPYTPLANATDTVVARLRRLRAAIGVWFWIEGLGRVLLLALALAAIDFLLDWTFRMDRAQRAVMLALMLCAVGSAIYRWLVRPLAIAPSDDALALAVERANPRLRESLISALQLSRLNDLERPGMSSALVRRTIEHGTAAVNNLNFGRVIDGRWQRVNVVRLASAGLLAAGFVWGAATFPPLRVWMSRNLLLSNARWPQQTYLVVERADRDGAVVFARGGDGKLSVAVRSDSEVVPAAVSLEFSGAGRRSMLAMDRAGDKRFVANFTNVTEPFEFRARGGDAVTDWVRVVLVDPPEVSQLKLVITPPRYTGEPPQALKGGEGPYHVLVGSSLWLEGTASKDLASARLACTGRRVLEAVSDDNERAAALENSLEMASGRGRDFSRLIAADSLVAGQYRVQLTDTLGLSARNPLTFSLMQRADQPPRVQVRLSGVGGMVTPRGRIPFQCTVKDDFGLTSCAATIRWAVNAIEGGGGAARASFADAEQQLAQARVGQPSIVQELRLEDAIDLRELGVAPGATLQIRFEASDSDDVSGPNLGYSSEFVVRVVSEDELRADLLSRERVLRQEFERLAKDQQELVTESRALAAALHQDAAHFAQQSELLRQAQKRQKQVGQSALGVAQRMASIVAEVENNRIEDPGGPLQTRLSREIVAPVRDVVDEMIAAAVSQLDRARWAESRGDREQALTSAVAQQSEAVVKMQEILKHMVQAEGFQEAVNMLLEIERAQGAVNEQTDQERRERIRRILERDGQSGPQGEF